MDEYIAPQVKELLALTAPNPSIVNISVPVPFLNVKPSKLVGPVPPDLKYVFAASSKKNRCLDLLS